MIPRVPFTSWLKVPSNSRTCFGPKRRLWRLHCPITRTGDDFKSHAPLKSIPLSLGPPQAVTSNEYFFKLSATTCSKYLPKSCLVIDEWHLEELHRGETEKMQNNLVSFHMLTVYLRRAPTKFLGVKRKLGTNLGKILSFPGSTR